MGQRQAQGLWLNGVRTSFWIVLDVDGNGDVEVGGDGNGNGGGDNNGDNEAQGDLESKNEDEVVDEGEDVSEGECDGDKNFKGDFFGDDDDDTCGDRADCVHVDINGAESAAGNGESDDVTTDIDKFRGKKEFFSINRTFCCKERIQQLQHKISLGIDVDRPSKSLKET